MAKNGTIPQEAEDAYLRLTGNGRPGSMWKKLQELGVLGVADFVARCDQARGIRPAVLALGIHHMGRFAAVNEESLGILRKHAAALDALTSNGSSGASAPPRNPPKPPQAAREKVRAVPAIAEEAPLPSVSAESGSAQAFLAMMLSAAQGHTTVPMAPGLEAATKASFLKAAPALLVGKFCEGELPFVEVAGAAIAQIDADEAVRKHIGASAEEETLLEAARHLVVAGLLLQGKRTEAEALIP